VPARAGSRHGGARTATELSELGGDVGVALGQRHHLVEHHHGGVSRALQLLEGRHQRGQHLLGAAGTGHRRLHPLDPHLALAPHDLHQQPLLGGEVVVQQPPGDAGLTRDLVEGRPGDPARGDADPHRLHDPLGLVLSESRVAAISAALAPGSNHECSPGTSEEPPPGRPNG